MSARWITRVLTAGMSSPLSTMLVDKQNIVLAVAEFGHHALELGRREAAMGLHHAGFGHDVAQAVGHTIHVLDPRHDAEHLAAAKPLALDRLTNRPRCRMAR